MMTRWIAIAVFSMIAAALVAAPPEHPEDKAMPPRPREMHKGLLMEPPVYEKEVAGEEVSGRRQFSPEARAKYKAMMQRRFEIMVLIQAYKIMPENQREPLKAELLRRIQEDFDASVAGRRAKIAAAEAELKRLREEIAKQEADKEQLVAREMDRLLKVRLPIPTERPDGAPPKGRRD